MFQNDLLPSLKGDILKIKVNRVYFRRRSVKLVFKIIGWIYVLGLLGFMLYYVFLFSVQKSAVNQVIIIIIIIITSGYYYYYYYYLFSQNAWALTFIISVVMDFILISTIMVLVLEVNIC